MLWARSVECLALRACLGRRSLRFFQTAEEPSSSSEASYVKELFKSTRLDEKLRVIDIMSRQEQPLQVDHYNHLIKACIYEGKLLEAVFLFEDEMKEQNVSPDQTTFETLINGHSRLGRPENVLRLYQLMQKVIPEYKPTRQALTRAIKAAVELKEYRAMHLLLDEMDRAGLEYSHGLFNMLLDVCASQGDWTRVQQLLEAMEEENLDPTESSYHTMLAARAREGNVEEAVQLWSQMEGKQMQITVVTANLLIQCFVQAGAMDGAMNSFRQLSKFLEPDFLMYSTLICGLSQALRTQEAEELLEEMYSRDLRANGKMWNALLSAYCVQESSESIQSCIERMNEEGVPIDLSLRKRFRL